MFFENPALISMITLKKQKNNKFETFLSYTMKVYVLKLGLGSYFYNHFAR